MNHSRRVGALARNFLCTFVAASLIAPAACASAHAQHEGHNSPAPARPKPKGAVRKSTPKNSPTRRSTTGRATRKRARTATRRPAANSNAVAPYADPHAGHTHDATPTTQQPVLSTQQPTPTPTPAPTPDPHAGHSMPAPNAPRPTPQQPTVDHSAHQSTQSQGRTERRMARSGIIPESPVVTLDELERLAAERNPTLQQAAASIRAAEGRRRQAGAFPNPTIGYFGEELAFRALGDNSEHGVFVEQTIPLGGKLGKSKRIFEREREQAEAIAGAQRQRVTNSVRMLYFEALGAQHLVELRADLADLAREAVEITKELYNVGQADRPDQLEIEIEAERAEIELLRAQTDWEQAWSALGAMTGTPSLRPARLAGSLEESATLLEQEQLLNVILRDSPEIRAARAGVERARAVISRERAERIPDLFVSGGVGYNNEILERDGRKTGAEGRIEVGVNVPVFNRNRGGIAAAEAELAIAERELERLQLSLRTRLATSFRAYRNAQTTVEKYRTQVVPRARQAYEMYLGNFRQMAASYPQVLIAQRTLFQVEVEYARALVELRRSTTSLRGLLLEGGLDAVGRPGESGERTEGFTLRSANEATGDSDQR
ncbi:MAG TPA: TolC family protein [Pyrinomonadaceae bacterium]|nr:TolC family protein [Pyrinomonadaceae bacterium]